MMRSILCFLVLISTPASSAEFYIVPVFARNVTSAGGFWGSSFLLTNPTDEDVTIELGETFGATNRFLCSYAEYSDDLPTVLRAHETRSFCMPFESAGAFTFTSSRPLLTNFRIVFTRHVGANFTQTFQHIEPGKAWIAPGQTATIYGVRLATGVARANLILVNPNGNTLTVSYTTVRTRTSPPESGSYLPVSTELKVGPKMLAIVPLLEAPYQDCLRRVPCGSAREQKVILTGDLEFYAAASSIESEDATFLSPVVSQP